MVLTTQQDPTTSSTPSKGYHSCVSRFRLPQVKSSWKAIMKDEYAYIFTAWILATFPMLLLVVSLVIVVKQSIPHDGLGLYSSDGGATNMPLGDAFYSKIPSTQLTFLASFSATLATVLLPAAMALSSYVAAFSLSMDSDAEDSTKLPSPYQLDLLIRSLNGNIISFWFFTRYVLGSRRKRVTITPSLQKSMSLLGGLILLTYEGSCQFG